MQIYNFEQEATIPSPDEMYMKEALKLAQKAFEEDEVPIGAVIVCKGKIIGKGYNLTERLHDVTAHAEMQAFTAAVKFIGCEYLHDCTLSVAICACVMCAGASYWTQIARIVNGARDEMRGYSTFAIHIIHPKTQIVSGVLEEECAHLMRTFFHKKR